MLSKFYGPIIPVVARFLHFILFASDSSFFFTTNACKNIDIFVQPTLGCTKAVHLYEKKECWLLLLVVDFLKLCKCKLPTEKLQQNGSHSLAKQISSDFLKRRNK